MDGRSQIKVHADEWTQVHSAQSSLVVTHPSTNRARQYLSTVTESPCKHWSPTRTLANSFTAVLLKGIFKIHAERLGQPVGRGKGTAWGTLPRRMVDVVNEGRRTMNVRGNWMSASTAVDDVPVLRCTSRNYMLRYIRPFGTTWCLLRYLQRCSAGPAVPSELGIYHSVLPEQSTYKYRTDIFTEIVWSLDLGRILIWSNLLRVWCMYILKGYMEKLTIRSAKKIHQALFGGKKLVHKWRIVQVVFPPICLYGADKYKSTTAIVTIHCWQLSFNV